MKAKARFDTDTPELSDATVARIRAAAHRFVLAGGSIFPSTRATDLTEHVGNVVAELQGTASAEFDQALDTMAPVSDPADRGRIHNAAWVLATEQSDAAFLFGAFVGLELAALTFGQALVAIPAVSPARRKRGAR